MTLHDLSYKIDGRSREDILREMGELAKVYTPEWSFDPSDPDAGSVIALIYAGQLEENLNLLNRMMEKYRTEFVNMLNLTLKPAYPASGVVTLSLIQETISGVAVPKGTKLLAESGGDQSIVFQTMRDLFVTNAHLRQVVALSRSHGRIIPIYGQLQPGNLLAGFGLGATQEEGGLAPEPEAGSGEFNGEPSGSSLKPFGLFDYSAPGIEANSLLLTHDFILDTSSQAVLDVKVLCREAEGSSPEKLAELAARLADPRQFSWTYYSGGQFRPYDQVVQTGCQIRLHKDQPMEPLFYGRQGVHCLAIHAKGAVTAPLVLDSLRFSSQGQPVGAQFVCHNESQEEVDDFMPFGETLNLLDECYIGSDPVLAQKGALVTLEFELSFKAKLVSFTPIELARELKPIMRKPIKVEYEPAETAAQGVAYEYFNGMGWRKLGVDREFLTLFDGKSSGRQRLQFICPQDMVPMSIGGFEGRSIRIRVTQADNCYMQPCLHKMPVVKNLLLTYDHQAHWFLPRQAFSLWGVDRQDLTAALCHHKNTAIFKPLPFDKNCMLLGFDRPMAGAPISIYFDVEDNISYEMSPVGLEYLSRGGFKPLEVIDHTDNLTHSGTVVFIPPQDLTVNELLGLKGCFIKLVDEYNTFDDSRLYHIQIRNIMPNTVEIMNVETLPQEYFYVNVATANMVFPLQANNILSAKVFVNELPRLSNQAMQQLLACQPENIRYSQDRLGNITEFFVGWQEIDSFDYSHPGDRHYMIDRMSNTIAFGDGVNVQIPAAQNAVAFTVQVTRCDGELGNLPAGAVNQVQSNLRFIGEIYNPEATYAGSNMEDVNQAHKRGANILSARHRLVSQLDYEREVLAFSSAIHKVKCLCGVDKYGLENPRNMTIAVLMKTLGRNNNAFESIKYRLKERLLGCCEMTIDPDELDVVEPLFVELRVAVWVSTHNIEKTLEIQGNIHQAIGQFLDPIGGAYGGQGWEIGTLVNQSQINMLIKSASGDFTIDKVVITGRYKGMSGEYETDLDNIRDNPFVMGTNGIHKIVVSLK